MRPGCASRSASSDQHPARALGAGNGAIAHAARRAGHRLDFAQIEPLEGLR